MSTSKEVWVVEKVEKEYLKCQKLDKWTCKKEIWWSLVYAMCWKHAMLCMKPSKLLHLYRWMHIKLHFVMIYQRSTSSTWAQLLKSERHEEKGNILHLTLIKPLWVNKGFSHFTHVEWSSIMKLGCWQCSHEAMTFKGRD